MTIRTPPLEGALNFRDLGGYATRDGRSVKWRMLYRSGTTHALTAADLATIAALGIRFAYDLRSNSERHDYPSRLSELGHIRYRFRDHDQGHGNLTHMLRLPDMHPERSRRMMLSIYRRMPADFHSVLQALFRQLIDGEAPLVFHCTAGKDRTGVAAALLLAALDVPREIILQDYLLTADCYEQSCALLIGDGGGMFDGISPEVLEPLMRVYPDYLDAMFDELDSSHGSILRYLEHLGVDSAGLERLRGNLLE